MADLLITSDSVTLKLSGGEKAQTWHRDLTFARTAIAGVRVVANCLDEVPGFKVIGASFPGSFKVGTWAGDDGRTFAACHGDGPGIVIDLAGEKYARIVLTCDNAEVLASQLA